MHMKLGVVLALLAGAVAAVYLVWSIGFDSVLAAVARAGIGGLALLCAFYLVVFLVLAAAWMCLLPSAGRRAAPAFYMGRLVRDSIAEISPFSPVGGMVAAARLMILNAAWRYDRGLPCGAQANAAKYLAAEAGFKTCQQAVMTHGGFGYAKEYHVERYLREVMIPRIAPVSPQLILCFIAEKVLGLPKSY